MDCLNLELDFDLKDFAEFRLYNSSGEMVREMLSIQDSLSQISCSDLVPGLYLAEIRTKNFRVTRKIILF
jgi:uncharacterized surface anchored protein